MNIPNKLTIIRICMIPVFLVFTLVNVFGPDVDKWIAVVIFLLASLTDFADGKIARRYNLVTNFGKFMDPLADKLLVCSALICLSGTKIPVWIVIVIIAREFIISGFRLIAADQGIVIAAGWWGKIKTTIQMIMIPVLLLDFSYGWYQVLEQILIYASLVLTLISLCDYIWNNRNVLKEQD